MRLYSSYRPVECCTTFGTNLRNRPFCKWMVFVGFVYQPARCFEIGFEVGVCIYLLEVSSSQGSLFMQVGSINAAAGTGCLHVFLEILPVWTLTCPTTPTIVTYYVFEILPASGANLQEEKVIGPESTTCLDYHIIIPTRRLDILGLSGCCCVLLFFSFRLVLPPVQLLEK